MDILKSFFINNQEYNVNILWEDDKPLFKANEIGKILGIKNIHSSLTNINEKYKDKREILTPGGNQTVVYLTEQGLYILLMKSNKPNAVPFQEWVTSILILVYNLQKIDIYILIL